MAQKVRRVYVKVRVEFDTIGKMRPLAVIWEDGRVFEVDKLLDVRNAPADVGGHGVRFTVRILGQETYLFFDDMESRWFVEGKG